MKRCEGKVKGMDEKIQGGFLKKGNEKCPTTQFNGNSLTFHDINILPRYITFIYDI